VKNINKLQKLLLTVSFILFIAVVQSKSELADTYITEWQGGAIGAYSFTFDNGNAGQWQYAVPILNESNIQATFFLNGASVAAWYSTGQIRHIHIPQMLNITAAGHEIGSLTYNHLNLADLNDIDVQTQMSLDQEFFNSYGIHPISFAYPFSRTDERVQAIVGQYVEFARGGYPMLTNSSSWNELNPLNLRWSSNGDYHYECVDVAIDKGTWAISVFNQIGFDGAGPTIEEFSAFVDYIAARRDAGELWVDTLGNIACYIRERYVAVITKKYDAGTNTIKIYLKVGLAYPYIVPLTLRTSINEYYIKSINQSEMPISYDLLNDQEGQVIQYDVIPDGGEVRIMLTDQPSE
jgi:peptidoglycan/xylan/chitin deacetylase (PgdA/CDA1 family)